MKVFGSCNSRSWWPHLVSADVSGPLHESLQVQHARAPHVRGVGAAQLGDEPQQHAALRVHRLQVLLVTQQRSVLLVPFLQDCIQVSAATTEEFQNDTLRRDEAWVDLCGTRRRRLRVAELTGRRGWRRPRSARRSAAAPAADRRCASSRRWRRAARRSARSCKTIQRARLKREISELTQKTSRHIGTRLGEKMCFLLLRLDTSALLSRFSGQNQFTDPICRARTPIT